MNYFAKLWFNVKFLFSTSLASVLNSGEFISGLKKFSGYAALAVILVLFAGFESFAQPYLSVHMVTSSTGYASGSSGGIIKTGDGGVTWTPQTSGTTLTLNSIFFVDANTGWTVGSNAFGSDVILKTTNGGQSWNSQPLGLSAPDLHSVSAANGSLALIVGKNASLQGLILRTTDGGASWNSISGAGANPLYGVCFIDANTAIAVGWGGVVLKSTDGGATWTQKFQSSTDIFMQVRFVNSTTGLIVGSAGSTTGVIFKSTNAGDSWTQQLRGGGAELYGVSIPDVNTAYAVGAYGKFQKSTDGGSTWAGQTLTAASSGVSFINQSTGVVVGGTAVLRTADGGSTWATESVSTPPPAPGSFNLLSPATGSTGQALSGTLSWQSSSNATSYDVYLDKNNPPTTLVSSSQAGTSYAYSGLLGGSTYYWKVVAKNSTGSVTATGAPWNFMTVVTAPGNFNLLSPANGAVGQLLSGTLSWQSSAGATGYDVYMDGNNPPTTLVSSNQAGTSYSYSGLLNGVLSYWKIVAKNGSGSTTATGAPWNFTTIIASPAAFALTSPSNGSTNQSLSGTLSWQSSTGATGYDVYLGTANPPTTVVSSNQLGTSYSYSGLLNGITYYWKIVANNAGGSTTATGAPWSFSTIAAAPPPPVVTTTAASSITASGATLNGSVNANGASTTAWFEWGISSTLTTYSSTVSQSAGSGTSAVATSSALSGLSPNTIYYYRAAAQNGGGTTKGTILSFTTGVLAPTVTTTAATSVTTSGATLNGSVNPNGASTTGWFEWGTSNTLATYSSTTSQSLGSGTSAVASSAALTGLSANTTYYYRAVGQNSAGTTRDGILSFTTGAVAPTVTTTAATSVSTSGATLNGSVNPNGASTTAWFEWGTSSTLTTYNTTTSQSLGSGTSAVASSAALTGLSANTTYYYRAVGQNSAGTTRDGILSFTTGVTAPTVTTTAATSVSTSGATLNGSVNPNGASTTGWFEWGTSSTLTTYNTTTSQSLGSGTSAVASSAALTGLSANTTYYYRAVGQNSAGTTRDGILSFTTGVTAPTVTTTAATSVSTSGATLNGSVNPNGAATTGWFEWGTSSTLATYTSTTSQSLGSGTSAVASSSALTGLSASTTYYYRAVGQNSAGTTRDGILSFTTGVTAPTVTTTAATSVTASGATLNSSINPNGASTTAWFEWGTSSTLATYSSTAAQSAGSSTSALVISSALSSLSPNTVYYYRAAAQNGGGTTKGTILSFTTGVTAPTVTTTAATSVTTSGATLNGSVNPNGAATTGWFEWGTSSTLATYNTTTSQSLGSGTSAVASSSALTGLSANTTYYYRAAAQNSAGTTRDGILSFTTGVTAPTVTTTAATSVTTSGATLNGSVNPNGASTTAWFEWGTSSTLATYSNTVAQSIGLGTSAVGTSSVLTGLSANTTYYYRAAGQNSAGTTRDGILSFTTGAVPPTVTTTAATSVTTSGATLNSSINPNGASTTAWFEWGTSSTLATYNSTATQSAGSSTSALAISSALSSLSQNTTYYYRAAAQNSAGTTRDGILSFTTTTLPPAAPSLASPIDGTVKETTTLTVSWNASSGATAYHLQVSTNAAFTALVVDNSGLTTTSSQVGPLLNLTTYYWRVSASNSGGSSAYSGAWSFTTVPAPPPPPILSSPANGGMNQPTSLTLTWKPANGATKYRLQLSSDSLFTNIMTDDSTIVDTSKLIGSLNNYEKCYWRVYSQNDGGKSNWAGAWNFTTIPPPPPATPTLASPANGASKQSTSLTLVWNASSGAAKYRVQVSKSSSFSSPVVDDSTVTTTSRVATGLSGNTKYYWRVNAANLGGTSAWSSAWAFTTARSGGGPKVAASVQSINFGAVAVDTTKKDSFQLTNVGDTTVNIVNIATTSSIFQVSETQFALGVGGTQNVYVIAAPQSPTNLTAMVVISYDNNLPSDTISVHIDSVSSVTGVETPPATRPREYALNQNFPNPFNPTTTISFSLPASSTVTLRVLNILGQEVATLIENQLFGAGDQTVEFDATHLASGAYFYRIDAKSASDASKKFTQVRKMLLIK